MTYKRPTITSLRKRIAELDVAHRMAEGLARHAFERRDSAEKELAYIRSMLPDNSIALPPQPRKMHMESRDGDRIVEDVIMPFKPTGPNDDLEDRLWTTRTLEQCVVECDQDELTRRTHVTLWFADGVARYAIADPQRLSKDQLATLIYKNAAPQMVRMVVDKAFK
jgi:hypothetical protein